MNYNESKRSVIENNIRAIQQRIQALESSFHEIEPEIIEDMPPEPVYIQPGKSMYQGSPHDSRIYPSERKSGVKASYRSARKSIGRTHRTEQEIEVQDPQFDPSQKVIEELLREIDGLKQKSNQQELKIETLNFRCDQLQNELSVKLDTVNKQAIEIEDRNTQLKNQAAQMKHLEAQIDQNKKSVMPQLQMVKSQNDICLLEIKSLENDNIILESRISELTDTNGQLRNDNRELRNTNSKIEMERLILKKEIEELKLKYYNYEDEIEELSIKHEETCVENERLKNELTTLSRKLSSLTSDISPPKQLERLDNHRDEVIGNFQREFLLQRDRFNDTANSNGFRDQDDSSPLINAKRLNSEAKSSNFTKNVVAGGDRLNFDGINSIEERLKKLNKF